ncbi:MAG TPA: 16S rRNA (guanine(527)-N(7))-methyltransferase RsmG [Candidatus Acidoferrum sp.]|nr:16S rRNA (guanine(527)-N(7))-methyltransferase RsmG [Candidatus Acidoferrum sp.]
METAAIAQLLQPFIEVDEMRLRAISTYIDILLRWNAHINLTAIRDPKEIVERHFGESFFAARFVLERKSIGTAIDLGSGAGFPGVPFAMFAPEVQVTLIESHQKKATFLKELVYALGLKNVRVFSNRAESYPETADLVMLRAVERFEQALQMAVQLTKAGGRMALMIGAGQVGLARKLVAEIDWCEPAAMPGSQSRELLLGTKS